MTVSEPGHPKTSRASASRYLTGEGDVWRCGQCGALVVDREVHDGFHERIDW